MTNQSEGPAVEKAIEAGEPPWMPKVGDSVVIVFGDGSPIGAVYQPVKVVHALPGWRFLLGDGSDVFLDKHITAMQPAGGYVPASALESLRAELATEREELHETTEALRLSLATGEAMRKQLRAQNDTAARLVELAEATGKCVLANVREGYRCAPELPPQQPTEAAPVAKAEAPSEPARWVPKAGAPCRAKVDDHRWVDATLDEPSTGAPMWRVTVDRSWKTSHTAYWVPTKDIAAPQPPAATGGAAEKPARAEQKDSTPPAGVPTVGTDSEAERPQEAGRFREAVVNPAGERGDFAVGQRVRYQNGRKASVGTITATPSKLLPNSVSNADVRFDDDGKEREVWLCNLAPLADPAQSQPQGDGVTRTETISEPTRWLKSFDEHLRSRRPDEPGRDDAVDNALWCLLGYLKDLETRLARGDNQ